MNVKNLSIGIPDIFIFYFAFNLCAKAPKLSSYWFGGWVPFLPFLQFYHNLIVRSKCSFTRSVPKFRFLVRLLFKSLFCLHSYRYSLCGYSALRPGNTQGLIEMIPVVLRVEFKSVIAKIIITLFFVCICFKGVKVRRKCREFRCDSKYNAVCGTDSQTYINSCFMYYSSCVKKDASLRLLYAGECRDEGMCILITLNIASIL